VLVRGSRESPHGTVVAEFDRDPVESGAGEMPLPHYIRRLSDIPGQRSRDELSYQTVYARVPGSAAAPTAGLHFTTELLAALRARGIVWHELTLQVGLGTFRPVKERDIRKHRMHEERYEIPETLAESVGRARREGRRILAVGTTTARALESAWNGEVLRAGPAKTSIFIHPRPGPGNEPGFRVVDRLLTNFHLPGSTLLMMVCAFAGRERVLGAYEEAVRREYRFYSYGDAMLIR
jgi:S-adenosylmethionine:tRNA ribosyltransferase-isomerase